jgi:hypothetical protein
MSVKSTIKDVSKPLLTELDCTIGHGAGKTSLGHLREHDKTILELNRVVTLEEGGETR